MDHLPLVLAILALALAFLAMRRAASLEQQIEDGRSDARRAARNVGEEVERELEMQRKLLARVAKGEPVSEDMVLEGRLWRDVDASAAAALIETESDVLVVDVRTPEEATSGMLPGARLIPVDQLEERLAELPLRDQKLLLYCAGGGRSAAACEFLSHSGYEALYNLEGGFGSWSGPVERPS